MGDAMTCDSCGAILKEREVGCNVNDDNGTWEWYCPNEECTSILGSRYVYDAVKKPDSVTKAEVERAIKHITSLPKKEDAVDNPSHYKLFGTIEVIDIIKELLTEEEFRGYLKGNCLKYRLRAGKKDDIEQDINKAMRYESWLK